MNKTKFSVLCLSTLTLFACSNGSSVIYSDSSSQPTSAVNVVPLSVDSGYNGAAFNRPFITLTVCQPGTTTCQTIDHIIVDTGSTGLRINQSALNLSLPSIEYNSLSLYQCMQYGGGYGFGPAVTANVKIGGESAYNIPMQIFIDNEEEQSLVPTSCTSGTSFADFNAMGAHGIIGVNPYSNPDNTYTAGGVYTCTSDLDCTEVSNPDAIPTKLNINPVAAFSQDNNGLILSLPNISTPTNGPVVGTITFGLDTESNNTVSSTVTTVLGDPTATWPVGFFRSTTENIETRAIFDSGTPTLDFYSATMAKCTESAWVAFYCPEPSPQAWASTINNYSGGAQTAISNSIVNYELIYPTGQGPSIVPYIGEIANPLDDITIYGLPYFFGKSIYLGLKGDSESGVETPLGKGPSWGFASN